MKRFFIILVLILWLGLNLIQQVGWIIEGKYNLLCLFWLVIAISIPIYIIKYYGDK